MPFFDWDESIYAQVGKEMVAQKSFVPLWQGQAWLEKPPLVPFINGILINNVPITPEISTRVLSLILSVIALLLIYAWSNKIFKSKKISLFAVILTAFNPIFLQRAQTLNTDIFLLIGWFGYFLYFSNFWLGLFFLFLGVFSKSLLGFYPLIILGLFYVYQLIGKKISKNQFLKFAKKSVLQVFILSIWFFLMLFVYKETFIKVHFTDHLLRRVTSSIESHFGKRTFYIDVFISQYSYFLLAALASLIIIFKDYISKKIKDDKLFLSLFLLPWFLFLNLTKTKISWYLYPAIPQVTFLLAYPLVLIKKHKYLLNFLVLTLFLSLSYRVIFTDNFFNSFYSAYDAIYKVSWLAKEKCSSLYVLISPTDRNTYDTLRSMNLLISTSEMYGPHPSIIYYFEKKVSLIYNKNKFISKIPSIKKTACLTLEKVDLDFNPQKYNLNLIKNFDSQYLFQKRSL